jgi:hypothetical protein
MLISQSLFRGYQAQLLSATTQEYDKIQKCREGVFGQHTCHQELSKMEKTLYNAEGEPVAYISDSLTKAIYLWDGHPVAYLCNYHVYGFNGRHLGWYIDGMVYDADGKGIGFTSTSCAVTVHKETGKAKQYPLDKPGPRYEAPPT